MMKEIETEISFVSFDGMETVSIIMKPNITLTKENVHQQILASHELKGELRVNILINITQLKLSNISREVMEYMKNNEYTKYQKKVAIVIEGTAQKIIGNIYLSVVKPHIETKFFTSEVDALKWTLSTQLA